MRRNSLIAEFGDVREDAADDRTVETKPMYRDDRVVDVPSVLPFALLSVYLRVVKRPRSFLKAARSPHVFSSAHVCQKEKWEGTERLGCTWI